MGGQISPLLSGQYRAGLTATRNFIINDYLHKLNRLATDYPDLFVSGRLWGDVGKYMHHTQSSGFIRGMYHQLDFMEDLRKADIPIAALEEGIGFTDEAGNGVRRYIDIRAAADDAAEGLPRRFETKSLSNYGLKNTENVVDGLRKDIGDVIAEIGPSAPYDVIERELDKIHIVFRGGSDGSGAMLDAMEKAGKEVLDSLYDVTVRKKSKAKLERMIDAARNSSEKTIPEDGDLVIFQGKRVPYGS